MVWRQGTSGSSTGRPLADHWQSSVATYERDETLCREGEMLAERARLSQRFYPVDVLSASMPPLTDQHAVALHACGELHRGLLRKVVNEALPAVDLAPCCYHLGAEDEYTPFTTVSQLGLCRDDLRLAVTETLTAPGRDINQRDRRGVAIFARVCFGHPSPSKQQKLHATVYAYGAPT
ncbi:methyltransferase, partial [Solemya pervernicosa gill symbiont]